MQMVAPAETNEATAADAVRPAGPGVVVVFSVGGMLAARRALHLLYVANNSPVGRRQHQVFMTPCLGANAHQIPKHPAIMRLVTKTDGNCDLRK